MAKYNDKAVAKKLDALSRKSRSRNTTVKYSDFFTNGHPPDVSTSATNVTPNSNSIYLYCTNICVTNPIKVKAVRFRTDSGNGSRWGRLYRVASYEYRGLASGTVIDRSFELAAISPTIKATGASSKLYTLFLPDTVLLEPSELYVVALNWSYTTSVNWITTTAPGVAGPHSAWDSFYITCTMQDTITVGSDTGLNAIPPISISLLSEKALALAGK